jgi:hypothetical protein
MAAMHSIREASSVEQGLQLVAMSRDTQWALGDWYVSKPANISLDGLPIEPRHIREAGKVAAAFPPHLRAPDVSYEVHACIAKLPVEMHQETLARASQENWTVKRARQIVTQHRQASAVFEDEDFTSRLATEVFRAWNRATPDAREYAWPLLVAAERAGFTIIDEDKAGDDA